MTPEQKTEREAVVAWLRGVPTKQGKLTERERNSRAATELIAVCNMLANAIERGDHHRKDGE